MDERDPVRMAKVRYRHRPYAVSGMGVTDAQLHGLSFLHRFLIRIGWLAVPRDTREDTP